MHAATTWIGTGFARAAFCLALGFAAAGPARAVPIVTGNGTFTSLSGLGEYQSSDGGGTLSAAGVKGVTYTPFPYFDPAAGHTVYPDPRTAPVTYTGYAAAPLSMTGGALLELRSSGSSADPGKMVGVRNPSPEMELEAHWSGVVTTITSPDGSPTPDAIRLGFQVAYSHPSGIQKPDWGFNTSLYHTQAVGLGGVAPMELRPPGDAASATDYPIRTIDADGVLHTTIYNEGPVTIGEDGLLHRSFSLTIPVSSAGVADPFAVSISSQIPLLLSDTVVNNESVVKLSLDSITLPDGTGLEDAGYAVHFDSGHPMPNPIPEPATWLAWGVLAAGSARAFRRRLRAS